MQDTHPKDRSFGHQLDNHNSIRLSELFIHLSEIGLFSDGAERASPQLTDNVVGRTSRSLSAGCWQSAWGRATAKTKTVRT
jgi:hypothetical protein